MQVGDEVTSGSGGGVWTGEPITIYKNKENQYG